MEHTETMYLLALGIVSIWIATLTDTLFVLVVKFWRRVLATRQARVHCLECIRQQLRPRRIRRHPHLH